MAVGQYSFSDYWLALIALQWPWSWRCGGSTTARPSACRPAPRCRTPPWPCARRRHRPHLHAHLRLGAGLAGFSGALLAPTTSIAPFMGQQFVAPAFITVVVGAPPTSSPARSAQPLLSLVRTPVGFLFGRSSGWWRCCSRPWSSSGSCRTASRLGCSGGSTSGRGPREACGSGACSTDPRTSAAARCSGSASPRSWRFWRGTAGDQRVRGVQHRLLPAQHPLGLGPLPALGLLRHPELWSGRLLRHRGLPLRHHRRQSRGQCGVPSRARSAAWSPPRWWRRSSATSSSTPGCRCGSPPSSPSSSPCCSRRFSGRPPAISGASATSSSAATTG